LARARLCPDASAAAKQRTVMATVEVPALIVKT
jgi:hypothetical protein